jgi:hypothetical protein
MGGVCGRYGREEKGIQNLYGKERDNLEHLDLEDKIILKMDLELIGRETNRMYLLLDRK